MILLSLLSGPFSPNKPSGQRSGPMKATATVKMNFPAYSPPSNVHASPSRVSSPPVRSSSMREFHTIRGEVAEGSGGGHGGPRPTTTHRTVSMSTQNLTDHQRRDNQSYYHHHQVPNKPRRSQSFNEKSMSSSGSLGHSGFSSSSTSSTGSSSSNTAEYPSSKTSSHAHSGYRTYALRETASLQTLPSSASYGGNVNTSHGTDGHLHQKHASHHHGGHHGQIRSSSVRNIPSASGYTVTTTTTAPVSTTSSLAGQSGRPIFSQPISATAARVESVDIPTQLQPSATMATNVRDLSSSYPGHHSQAGSSSSRAASGQIHGGGRGENPKPSRRHLHKV